MVELKTEAEVDAMAAAGAVVAEALRAVAAHAGPGSPRPNWTRVAADVLARHGARRRSSTTTRVGAAARSPRCCASASTTPSCTASRTTQVLADGDLVSIDFGAILRGWCGDARAQLRRRHAAARRCVAHRGDRRRPGGRHRRGTARQHARRHRTSDRFGRPRRRLRHARRPRRTRHRPHDARGSARAERGPRRQGHAAAAGAGDRHRTDADRRRHRRLRPRLRRVDAAHGNRSPCRAQRAHRRGHRATVSAS